MFPDSSPNRLPFNRFTVLWLVTATAVYRRYRLYVTASIELFELVSPVFINARFVEINRLVERDIICGIQALKTGSIFFKFSTLTTMIYTKEKN